MLKRTITITIIVLGLILGSVARLDTTMVGTKVNYFSTEDVKVYINDGDNKKLGTLTLADGDLIPCHFDGNNFYKSATLTMDDLKSITDQYAYYYITKTVEVYTSKTIDNTYLQAELVVEGEDELNGAIRAIVKTDNNKKYVMSQESPTALVTDIKLTSTPKSYIFYFYYELEDENVTIENLNASTGANVSLNLYAYIEG